MLCNPVYRLYLGFHYHIGIYLCRAYIGMTEQLVNRVEVAPAAKGSVANE